MGTVGGDAGLMALSTATVIGQIRTLVATVSGIKRVFAASETGDNAIPVAINELPAALIFPGATVVYHLESGGHRHTYDVKVQVVESGPDIGQRAATVLPFVDAIIELFAINVSLGARANSCVFKVSSGLTGLEYGGIFYTGYDITLEVSEQENVTPAPGA